MVGLKSMLHEGNPATSASKRDIGNTRKPKIVANNTSNDQLNGNKSNFIMAHKRIELMTSALLARRSNQLS